MSRNTKTAQLVAFTLFLICLVSVGSAQQPARAPLALGAEPDKFAALAFLSGTWTATPDADSAKRLGIVAGQPSGVFTFLPELNGQVLVRRNIRGAVRNQAYARDDVLYIYFESGALRAIYFDTEGHVIHYSVSTAADSAVFLSDVAAPGPRFRLSYHLNGESLDGLFEVAAPGSADFHPYLHWTSTKAKK